MEEDKNNEKKRKEKKTVEEIYIDEVIKEMAIRKIREEARGLPIKDLGIELETQDFKIDEENISFKKGETSYSGWASFRLLVDGEQIADEVETSFDGNSIEIASKQNIYYNTRDYITSIIEKFAKVKSLWYQCDICGKQIEIMIEWYPRSYVYHRKLSVISGKELDCNLNAVYQKLREIIWNKRDETAKENFGTITIDDFKKLEKFKESAEKIIGSLKKPPLINRPKGRGFFGRYDICADCQEKVKPEMTLEEIAELLPDFRELNKEYWEEIKQAPIKCELKSEL